MDVARVDLTQPDAPQRFYDSLRETGFAVLTNHPLPPELIRQVQAEWLDFFDGESKWEYLPGQGEQHGYHPMHAAETALGAAVPDIKEYFHWYPWQPDPLAESGATVRMYDMAVELGRTLLTWVEAGLPAEVRAARQVPLSELPVGSTRTLLRILRYPPLSGDEPDGAVRAAAHEDVNLITVLPAATEPGLQARDVHGVWHDVPCDPGNVVVNVGDGLSLATGHHLPSTTHRVVNPTDGSERRSRMSTPVFLAAHDDAPLADGWTGFTFLRQRLRDIAGIELQR